VKILSVDKGFHKPGGMQLFGKFKSLKHCMKACAKSPTCFAGDYNPWLHKCYQHSNYTACVSSKSHPQFVHFSKVPCCEYNNVVCGFACRLELPQWICRLALKKGSQSGNWLASKVHLKNCRGC